MPRWWLFRAFLVGLTVVSPALAPLESSGVRPPAPDVPRTSDIGLGSSDVIDSPQQIPGGFKSNITLVPVDVRVVDRGGRPVMDLTQKDFTVFEDGVRQTISHFTRYGLTPETPPPISSLPVFRKAPGFDLSAQHDRIFLIVLGRGRLDEPSKAFEALLHFIRSDLLPQDQVAVLAYNRATDFTTDHEQVARVVERFARMNDEIEGRVAFHLSGANAVYGTRDLPVSVQALIDAVFTTAGVALPEAPPSTADKADEGRQASDPGRIGHRQLLPEAIPESRRIEDDARRTMSHLMAAGNSLTTDLPFEEFISANARTMQDLGNLYSAIEYMRWLEGEKHLVYVTEQGLFLPRIDDDERLAAAANNGRIAIDTFQTGGVWSGQIGGRIAVPGSWTQIFAYTALRRISQLSGGVASITEHGGQAVQRIDDTTRAGYLIGYYPSKPDWNGRYRNIDVKVNRPGLELVFRHGYYARDVVIPADRQTFLTYNRIISAAAYPDDVRDIKLSVTASIEARGPDGQRDLVATVKVDPSRVSFVTGGAGSKTALLDIALFAADQDERVIDERWQKMDVKVPVDAYPGMLREGIQARVRMPWTGRVKSLKAVVYDYKADLLGSARARVY